MKIGLAFRAFFLALFNREKATAIETAIDKQAAANLEDASKKAPPKSSSEVVPQTLQLKSGRSEALTLLSVLQREARLLDLVQEPLANYSDAQVGAAARDVLQQTHKVLQRMFDIQPLCDKPEGEMIDRPAELSGARWKPIGEAANKAKVTVVHPGWVANTSQIPVWTGSKSDEGVLMPTEVE